MKSITKKISLLALLSAVLFLSSCLDSGDNSYFGNDEYSYITQTDMGGVYARTAAGFLITSERINLMTPGSVALLTYQIDDDTEQIKIDDHTILHKVRLAKEPTILNPESLQNRPAPEDSSNPVYFDNILTPPLWVTQSSLYFGDRWPFTVQYKAKKGENMKVSFYRVPDDELPENLNADVLVDIRMIKTGTPESGAQEELKRENIVANMSLIRDMSSNIEVDTGSMQNPGTKDVRIKFRFYRQDIKEELYISHQPIVMTVAV